MFKLESLTEMNSSNSIRARICYLPERKESSFEPRKILGSVEKSIPVLEDPQRNLLCVGRRHPRCLRDCVDLSSKRGDDCRICLPGRSALWQTSTTIFILPQAGRRQLIASVSKNRSLPFDFGTFGRDFQKRGLACPSHHGAGLVRHLLPSADRWTGLQRLAARKLELEVEIRYQVQGCYKTMIRQPSVFAPA